MPCTCCSTVLLSSLLWSLFSELNKFVFKVDGNHFRVSWRGKKSSWGNIHGPNALLPLGSCSVPCLPCGLSCLPLYLLCFRALMRGFSLLLSILSHSWRHSTSLPLSSGLETMPEEQLVPLLCWDMPKETSVFCSGLSSVLWAVVSLGPCESLAANMVVFWTTGAQNIGMIAGAVCGVVVGLSLLFLAVRLTIKRKEKKRYEEEEAPNEIR